MTSTTMQADRDADHRFDEAGATLAVRPDAQLNGAHVSWLRSTR